MYHPRGKKETHNVSSLVIIGYVIKLEDKGVRCFSFEVATRKGRSATSMQDSLLKQMASGTERILGAGVSPAFQEQKRAIGGCGQQLVPVVCCTSTWVAKLKPDHPLSPLHTRRLKSQHQEIIITSTPPPMMGLP